MKTLGGLLLLGGVLLFCFGGALVIPEVQANTVDLGRRYQPPSAVHPFGTDSAGRDLLARTVYGGQISLGVGLLASLFSVTLGTGIGLASGWLGGVVDFVLMRFTEALLAIPVLVLLLLFSRALVGTTALLVVPGREPLSASVLAVVLLIGLLGWMRLARLVRAQVLSLKAQEFVLAARALGASPLGILRRHILPHCADLIVVTFTLSVGTAIVTEAYLSFFGFGVQPPTATWGNILTRARAELDEYPWQWLAPGTLMVLTVLAVNGLGEALQKRVRR